MDKNSFTKGQLTIMAEKNLNDDYVDILDYLRSPDNFVKFSDGIKTYIKDTDCDVNDDKSIKKYIKNKAEMNEVDLPMPTIEKWIKGTSDPRCQSVSKENVYKLCFALGMDEYSIRKFFSKVYLFKAFDCREWKEIVYLYCVRKGFKYIKAAELISIIDQEIKNNNIENKDITQTNVIAAVVDKIDNENDLINYIIENKHEFNESNTKATKIYNELLKQAMLYADAKGVDTLFKVMYECDIKALKDEGKGSIKDFGFDDIIKMNFPQKEQFQQIKNGIAKYDTIRKALILLKFYNVFQNDEMGFDDFVEETDDMLNECGYALLYVRNPYDFLFMYCANCDNPIYCLQDILEDMLPVEESFNISLEEIIAAEQ